MQYTKDRNHSDLTFKNWPINEICKVALYRESKKKKGGRVKVTKEFIYQQKYRQIMIEDDTSKNPLATEVNH